MDVSIIIVNYNSFDYTLKCIDSLFRYSHSFSFEVLLFDNGSKFFDKEIISQKYPKIVITRIPENIGFAKAVNMGLKLSQGEFILLLNNDTELLENSILICLNFLKTHIRLGFLSPKIIYPDGEIQRVANSFPSIRNILIQLLRLTKVLPAKYISNQLLGEYFDHLKSLTVDWIWGTFLIFNRKLLAQFENGLLPDKFFLYYEDVSWSYTANKKGFPSYYLADTSVVHHHSKSLGENLKLKDDYIIKNEKEFLILEKGSLYTFTYFMLKGLLYLSQRNKSLRRLGIRHLKYFSI